MARAISLHPSPLLALRNATRLLSMIHELHKAGYQRLRFWSGMAASGGYWRCLITHADNVAADGLEFVDANTDTSRYTTGNEDRYFGWPDAPGRSARELAARFVERFPKIVARADGLDWSYAGWLTDMLGKAELGGGLLALPIFFADYPIAFAPEDLPPPPTSREAYEGR